MTIRVLEIGTYISISYAGMLLAEQGHDVTKWCQEGLDPVQTLKGGDYLWAWLNDKKTMAIKHAKDVNDLQRHDYDLIIDNVRAETWQRWGVHPESRAVMLGLPWVSLRDDLDGRGFDAIAQARAWGDHVGYVPVYLGDTGGGLWLAFKALSMLANGQHEHAVIRQAACLAKLIEGELLDVPRDGSAPPWDEPGTYGRAADGSGVEVHYRGEVIREPFRDGKWRRENLRHSNGRLIV